MKNQKLQMKFASMKGNTSVDIEILSNNEESSLLGGNCPMLTSCTTYVDCENKYKKGDRDAEIKLPDIKLT